MIAAIALGSNLPSAWGTPAEALDEAVRRLHALGRVTAVSAYRTTEPVGFLEQPRFTNAVALLETELAPFALLPALLRIEAAMGRVRSADLPAKGPRMIDLDLLLCEDGSGRSIILNTPELVLPHPAMQDRSFVLDPLAEIAPEMRHPLLGRSASELAAKLRMDGR